MGVWRRQALSVAATLRASPNYNRSGHIREALPPACPAHLGDLRQALPAVRSPPCRSRRRRSRRRPARARRRRIWTWRVGMPPGRRYRTRCRWRHRPALPAGQRSGRHSWGAGRRPCTAQRTLRRPQTLPAAARRLPPCPAQRRCRGTAAEAGRVGWHVLPGVRGPAQPEGAATGGGTTPCAGSSAGRRRSAPPERGPQGAVSLTFSSSCAHSSRHGLPYTRPPLLHTAGRQGLTAKST